MNNDIEYVRALEGDQLPNEGEPQRRIGVFFRSLQSKERLLSDLGISVLSMTPPEQPSQAEISTPLGDVQISSLVILHGAELCSSILFTAAPKFPGGDKVVKLIALTASSDNWLDDAGKNHITQLRYFDLGSVMRLLIARQLRTNTEVCESFRRAPV